MSKHRDGKPSDGSEHTHRPHMPTMKASMNHKRAMAVHDEGKFGEAPQSTAPVDKKPGPNGTIASFGKHKTRA